MVQCSCMCGPCTASKLRIKRTGLSGYKGSHAAVHVWGFFRIPQPPPPQPTDMGGHHMLLCIMTRMYQGAPSHLTVALDAELMRVYFAACGKEQYSYWVVLRCRPVEAHSVSTECVPDNQGASAHGNKVALVEQYVSLIVDHVCGLVPYVLVCSDRSAPHTLVYTIVVCWNCNDDGFLVCYVA